MPGLILTLTPNPSIDATIALNDRLLHGAVNRAAHVTQVAGGKGLNVSLAAQLAEHPTAAIVPARDDDPFIRLASRTGIACHRVPITPLCRVNTTVNEPGGKTTKLNGPGPALSAEEKQAIEDELAQRAPAADWIVLGGSLPGGVPVDWYCRLVQVARAANPTAQIAVDTSEDPLCEIVRELPASAPDLVKPNAHELAQIPSEFRTGSSANATGDELEAQAAQGDCSGIISAARVLTARGVGRLLVTLGSAGAVLVTDDAAWSATPPPIDKVASTVGAGDATLAGFILAESAGASPAEALRQAVAYGSAAVTLPGSELPAPGDVDIAGTQVREL